MSLIPKKIRSRIKIGIAITSPVVFILSLIADITAVAEKYSSILQFIMVISSLSVIGFSIYYIWFARNSVLLQDKLAEQEQKIDILEQEICEGKRLTKSEAIVTFDVSKKKYLLNIKKEYQIISDRIKWFECQFYCNNRLTDAKAAQEHYRINQVTWEELDVKASLSYKNPGDNDFCAPIDVFVKQVAEGNNYKRFHVLYQTLGRDSLDIRKGSEIILDYRYCVPVEKWGSYLNRYVSYWCEETKISIACSNKDKVRKTELKIYRTTNDGKPVLSQDGAWKDCKIGEKYAREMILKPSQCTKFIIWWDANEVFKVADKDLNTQIGVDELQLTQY